MNTWSVLAVCFFILGALRAGLSAFIFYMYGNETVLFLGVVDSTNLFLLSGLSLVLPKAILKNNAHSPPASSTPSMANASENAKEQEIEKKREEPPKVKLSILPHKRTKWDELLEEEEKKWGE